MSKRTSINNIGSYQQNIYGSHVYAIDSSQKDNNSLYNSTVSPKFKSQKQIAEPILEERQSFDAVGP